MNKTIFKLALISTLLGSCSKQKFDNAIIGVWIIDSYKGTAVYQGTTNQVELSYYAGYVALYGDKTGSYNIESPLAEEITWKSAEGKSIQTFRKYPTAQTNLSIEILSGSGSNSQTWHCKWTTNLGRRMDINMKVHKDLDE